MARNTPRLPDSHPSGAKPPTLDPRHTPKHVAIVMDGNGRWAKARGLQRTEGHTRGEGALFDVIQGAIEIGVRYLSVFAFSTENWRRSPEEVRWLLGFNRRVIHDRRDSLNEMGVKVLWAGRAPKLWQSVIKELKAAEELSKDNDTLTFQFCMNYGGRAEIVDAVQRIAQDVEQGKLHPSRISEKTFRKYLYQPEIPDVDLFIRSSGELRLSNFQLWESAYAEFVFSNKLWPDFDRRDLWAAIENYAARERRYGSV